MAGRTDSLGLGEWSVGDWGASPSCVVADRRVRKKHWGMSALLSVFFFFFSFSFLKKIKMCGMYLLTNN